MPYFTFDKKKVFYKITGVGDPLLLLAGNTASSKMFNPVIKNYSKHFRVILIDFPGHGHSERLEKFAADFWYYNAEVCYQLLNFLKIDKISVIGTSGGALVAINLCLEHPEKIKYLVADSFEGEYPLDTYINSLHEDRAKSKKNLLAKLFWIINHGFDWRKIVDSDTEMLINFHQKGLSFFHKPITELTTPTLLTGSREDEYCHELETIYKQLQKRNNRLSIFMFEKGGHPAMISNKKEFFNLIKTRL